ncbi:MAG: VacJ family lipoprotein, partial [Candidatus Sulfotelmatobacter sp.]
AGRRHVKLCATLSPLLLTLFAAGTFTGGAVAAAPLQRDEPSPVVAEPDPQEDTNDPLESINRAVFDATVAVDHAVIRPIAIGYGALMPEGFRHSVRNFLNNLDSPPILANQLFQGEFQDAGITAARFGVNTTVGVGGLFEVSADWGLPRHSADFGETLGKYGVGEGPYLFLPLIGPAPPRDLAGRVVDYFLDPLSYVQWGSRSYVPYLRVTLDAVDLRQRNIEALDEVEHTSVDYYASVRSLYRQTRNYEINNDKTNMEKLPNF